MKVITLTADQVTKINELSATRRAASAAAGVANKAYSDYVSSLVGGPLAPMTRAELADDGKTLVVG